MEISYSLFVVCCLAYWYKSFPWAPLIPILCQILEAESLGNYLTEARNIWDFDYMLSKYPAATAICTSCLVKSAYKESNLDSTEEIFDCTAVTTVWTSFLLHYDQTVCIEFYLKSNFVMSEYKLCNHDPTTKTFECSDCWQLGS